MKSIADGFTSVKKKSLADQAHDEILEMIIKRDPEEENVLTEGRLVELLGISKAPVREALIRLCNENVLKNIPRFGYAVMRMEERDAREVAGLRILLETEALQSGFENIVASHLEKIRIQIEDRKVPEGGADVWDILADNEEFHLLLASFAGNRTLDRFLRECLELQKRIYAQVQWNHLNSLKADVNRAPHQRIYQALCERNLEKSIIALKTDIMSQMEEGKPGWEG